MPAHAEGMSKSTDSHFVDQCRETRQLLREGVTPRVLMVWGVLAALLFSVAVMPETPAGVGTHPHQIDHQISTAPHQR